MRKFGFDRNGVSIGSTRAIALGKLSCGRLGFNFLPDARMGAVVGHLIEEIEHLEAQIAVLQHAVANIGASVATPELIDVRSLPATLPHGTNTSTVELPEHLRGDYRKMTGEQRKELKDWRAKHAA